jgi:hypothetical protein
MLVILLGALLIIGGVMLLARQTISRGRLSDRRPRAAGADVTLEPRERGGGFGLATHWPGFALIALGAVLLLARAAGLV